MPLMWTLLLAHVTLVAATEVLVCPRGSYWDGSVCRVCPAGRYGGWPGLTSAQCSGPCAEGHFCPPGSTTATQNPCGSARYYCPKGSGMRQAVDVGYYTVQYPFPTDDSATRSQSTAIDVAAQQRHCEPGYYCVIGVRRACPAGTYGESSGLSTPMCTGPCPKGHYCPPATATPFECPPGTFGEQLGLTEATCSGLCPIGHYCPSATISPRSCPAGRYGGTRGLKTKACSAHCSSIACAESACPEGFYCPLAATSPLPCGGVGVYCPEGSALPTPVSVGYYTTWKTASGLDPSRIPGPDAPQRLEDAYIENGDLEIANRTTRTAQRVCERGSYCIGGTKRPCPSGTFGDSEGLATAQCSGPCPAGFACPIGTMSFRQVPCTDRQSFCPQGSAVPTPVSAGYFTVRGAHGDIRTAQQVCPLGSYCIGGIAYLCPKGTYGATTGLATAACSGRCQDGYTCPVGSTSATQVPCPAGSYSRNGITCSPCAPGYWCAAGSPDPRQNECGADSVFCPLGSANPQSVATGFYAVGQGVGTHTSQAQCLVQNVRHLPQCPTRTIGSNSGL